MPDWQELVCQGLSGLALDAAEKDEVHAELAGHLQEFYESLRAQGLDEHAALSQTWARIGDWEKLRRKIQMTRQKESTVTPRASQLWLSSLATLLVSMIMPPVLERLELNPHFVFPAEHCGNLLRRGFWRASRTGACFPSYTSFQ